jgi:hypothetical protein
MCPIVPWAILAASLVLEFMPKDMKTSEVVSLRAPFNGSLKELHARNF